MQQAFDESAVTTPPAGFASNADAAFRTGRDARAARVRAGSNFADGKVVDARKATAVLEAVIRPGDRVCLEGDNQKQADLLARALAAVDVAKVHDLHMVQSGVVLPEHLDVFDSGIAKRLDYSYSGPQAARIARMLFGGKIELGAVHTYLELFARYFIDLTPHVALIAGGQRRPVRQSLHRTQHRGHADRRRGDGLQGRHRHRAGERDRRQGAPRRHPGRSCQLRREGGQAVLCRAALHPRSGRHHRGRRSSPRCSRSRASTRPMASSG